MTEYAQISTRINTVPLIDDLNKDGIDDLIVASTPTAGESDISIYSLPSLALEYKRNIYTNGSGDVVVPDGIYSMDIADINNDNLDEIIWSSQTAVGGFSWNGTPKNLTTAFPSLPPVNTSVIACSSQDKACFIAWFLSESPSQLVWAYLYNGSNVNSGTGGTGYLQIEYAPGQTTAFCPPILKKAVADDYNNDGTVEYILSYLKVTTSDDYVVLNSYKKVGTVNLTTVSTSYHDIGDSVNMTTNNQKCSGLSFSQYITPPIVKSITSVNTDKHGAVVGSIMSQSPSFGFVIYDTDLQYSEIQATSTNGLFISNVAYGTIFPSGASKDYCMMIFNNRDAGLFGASPSEHDVLYCGSKTASFGFLGLAHTQEYALSTDGDHNTSRPYNVPTNMLHLVESNSSYYGSEILYDHGIYNRGDGTLIEQFKSLNPDSMALPENSTISRPLINDIISYDGVNLWDLTTNPINYGCTDYPCIQSLSFNPCITNSILQNSTMDIQVKISDHENDNIRGRVTIYYNDANSQATGWSQNYSSGATLVFSNKFDNTPLIANLSGNNFLIYIEASDASNPLKIQSYTRYFSVSPYSGINKGDAICAEAFNTNTGKNTTFNDLETSPNDNAVALGAKGIASRLNMSVQVVCFILIIIVSLILYVEMIEKNMHPLKAGAFTAGLAFALLFACIVLGFIQPLWLILPVLFLLGYFLIIRPLLSTSGG